MGILGGILNALIGASQERAASQSGGRQQAGGVTSGGFPPKQKVYCKWCGVSYSDVRTLVTNTCSQNPDGRSHVLYEGSEKPQYVCKFCGQTYSTISTMAGNKNCAKKPNRRHEPV
jgi:hypothetical protein